MWVQEEIVVQFAANGLSLFLEAINVFHSPFSDSCIMYIQNVLQMFEFKVNREEGEVLQSQALLQSVVAYHL